MPRISSYIELGMNNSALESKLGVFFMLDIIDITNSSLFILSASESSTAKYHILLGFSLGLSIFHQPFNLQKTLSLCIFSEVQTLFKSFAQDLEEAIGKIGFLVLP